MKKIKYLIIVVLIFISVTSVITYSYFTANVVSNDVNDVNVSSGNLKIRIDDNSVNSSEISPIYDEDYEMLAYDKDFEVISESSLSSCSKIYLHINNISDSLRSEDFKYRIISEGIDVTGNFVNAKNGEDLLILDNLYLESNATKYLDLYLWISYRDDVDQMDLLGTQIDAQLVVNALDSKSKESCEVSNE